MKENKEKYTYGFIRAVNKEFADNYFNNGEIYINTIAYYQELEQIDSNVGDSKENLVFNFPNGEIYISTKMSSYSLEELANKDNYDINFPSDFVQGSRKDHRGVIHCLYMTKIDIEQDGNNYNLPVDSKYLEEFKGCRFFLIFNHKEYVNRILSKLEQHGLTKIKCGKVSYFNEKEDEKFDSKGDPFLKREKYIYQNEYRIFISKKDESPLKIHIGCIKDIAIEVYTK